VPARNPAREYEPMVRLLRDTMGLQVELEEPTTTELSLPSGDRVQVFAPAHPYFAFLGRPANGPVALFEVDELRSARAQLAAAGIEIVGAVARDGNWEWVHFRAPDGNLYVVAERRRGPKADPGP
jgi:hypothetical protein